MTSVCKGCGTAFEQPQAQSRRKSYCTDACRLANGPWAAQSRATLSGGATHRGQVPPEQRRLPYWADRP